MPALLRKLAWRILAGCWCGNRGAGAVGGVDEVLQLFARLEKRNLLGFDFDLLSGFRVAAYAPAALAGTEAAKAANLDLLAFLQRADDAFENGLNDRFRFAAREFGYPQNLFDEVRLRQCGLLAHRSVASLPASK